MTKQLDNSGVSVTKANVPPRSSMTISASKAIEQAIARARLSAGAARAAERRRVFRP